MRPAAPYLLLPDFFFATSRQIFLPQLLLLKCPCSGTKILLSWATILFWFVDKVDETPSSCPSYLLIWSPGWGRSWWPPPVVASGEVRSRRSRQLAAPGSVTLAGLLAWALAECDRSQVCRWSAVTPRDPGSWLHCTYRGGQTWKKTLLTRRRC